MSLNGNLAVRATDLSKCYLIYDRPQDRLKQWVFPRLQRLVGVTPKPYYHEFWALHEISLEISKGETVGIIGRNGSGKSTLLQLICGTLNPTGGAVEARGRVAALLELGSGFNPEFTGRENVYMNAAVLGLKREEIDSRIEQIVDFADIGGFIEQPVKTYSSGMLVRLAFAVIAHVDADILIIDEALSVGDAFFTQKCMRFLRTFMKAGTVLFVSHDTSSVINLCDRAVWLEKGRILESGVPKTVCGHYLEAFYEAQQGKSSSTQIKSVRAQTEVLSLRDQRLDFINSSNLRNDLRVFQFDPEAPSFGKGGAKIENAYLLDDAGSPLAWIVGGEKVTLRVVILANEHLVSPIVGFFVRDRLGQDLFGDNTFFTYREQCVECRPGEHLQVDFVFLMPLLKSGEYSVTISIAEGTQDVHVQHQWIHDAIVFKSESSSVAGGIVGIPMLDIDMQKLEFSN